jgi:hypothetical protein
MNSPLQPGSLPHTSLSPLFATHTSRPQITENTTTLSPFLATHTDFAPVSPVFATHTKTTGVYTNSSRFGTEHPRRMRVLSESAAADESKDFSLRPSLTILSSSRDEKAATINPLESAFTNCDARNPFGMCIYENCRVSSLFSLLPNLPTFNLAPSLLRHRPPLCYHPASQPGRRYEL